jgi:putative ABC transport system substrate-binding protein
MAKPDSRVSLRRATPAWGGATMKRRDFIALVGAAAWPLSAHAQQRGRLWRIACLVTGSPESHGGFVAAFRRRLGEMGYVEGRDVAFELRWAQGQVDRLPALATEIAGLGPDVVVTATAAAAVAAKQAMPATPIVSATLVDPIGTGLVTGLARPGGNVTGISLLSFESLLGKQLDLAREVIPDARRVGMLVNTRNPAAVFQRDHALAAAPTLGLDLKPIEVHTAEELEATFRTFAHDGSQIVLVPADALFITERRRVAALALAARLPVIAALRDITEAGGLVSYGNDLTEHWTRAAYYVDRILKGTKPADLPIEQPTKYELVINLKTAKALGLTIPANVLARADEVIE